MKQVQKKSMDQAVNTMLVKARRSEISLAWDRAESQQPQCGFGRLNLCCTDCYDGPCRFNPFGDGEEATICGRERGAMEGSRFLRRVSDGAGALLKLAAGFGRELDSQLINAMVTDDDMLEAIDMKARMDELGHVAAGALQALGNVTERLTGDRVLAANLGALRADAPNLLVYGAVAPTVLKTLAEKAAQGSPPVNVMGACGGEGEGLLPIVTNYVSQEIPFLTGAVDLLIVGAQCVTPASLELASKLGISTVYAKNLRSAADIAAAVGQASTAFGRRAGKVTAIPGEQAILQNIPGTTGTDWAQEIIQHMVAEKRAGLAFLGGCGQIGATQDKAFVAAAKVLMQEGWKVVSAGCAGAALAKAGLCQDGGVVYLGSCHDAGRFLELAKIGAAAGQTTRAVFHEVTHNKVLATAVAFAVNGIATMIDQGDSPLPADADCNGVLKAVEN